MQDRAAFATAEDLLHAAVARRVFPAAVAEVGTHASVLWRGAFGTLTFDQHARPAELDTIFDLASLTKPIATASVVLALARAGALGLDDRVTDVIPEWAGADRVPVTIRTLLEHSSGLLARLVDQPPRDRRGFAHEICTLPLEYPCGTRSIYSDLGFILLGFCAEQRGHGSLAEQTRATLGPVFQSDSEARHVEPLMAAVPPELRRRTAPTLPLPDDHRRGRRLVGEVHDNYAAALGGFAGHAGLFGTAAGVGGFARVMLRAARGDTSMPMPFTPAVVKGAITRSAVSGSSRALAWDTMLPTSSCGARLSAEAFGHVGFTGTSLWIDPVMDRYFVLLTNRVCEGGTTEQMQEVRRTFHDALATI